MKTQRRILLVDDHPLMREGLALHIQRQPEWMVCGEAGGCREAMTQVAELRPDLAVIDLGLPDGSGLELIRDIRSRYPTVAVLALSMQDERIYARRVLDAGAGGYLMKQEATERVVEAIWQILNGHVYVSSAIRQRLVDSLSAHHAPLVPGSPTEVLTDRELEVFRLLGEGLRTRDAAARLHVSVKTVQTYCERIKSNLGLNNFYELVHEATLWVHRQPPED